ncbi:efflux RND transporter permease subunit [Methylobacterium soli]|uniref:CusA/CzcA family heavy metal efflux RND transporter n=1 Tax=Methylobacterium soli TaxID=553447 RepID=A0A6L3T3I5_9HYPH|nr:CusA/CzcA family heavy metal efflux RND transporter [Methylobacterium soli]KAB1081375.1 CusA/CzcA family heavy metal efflux RND transporter [Methylobacterium soli]GJE45397.1 Nickel and cobalt resistance protein CnrA [Methylobacterium soli]
MIETILAFSIRQRWLVLLASLAAAAFGLFAALRLPIDAVPDITNNQVQVNAVVPQLSPFDVENQVTYPIETALAGIRGLEVTRSLSRNGFAQVTAIFNDATDVYFARQQVSERLGEVKTRLPPGTDVHLGPISTGLGEVTMWSVAFTTPHQTVPAGQPGFQPDGSYLTAEGQRLRPGFEQAAYLRTLQDWVIGPQLRTVPGVAGVDVIGGYRKQYQIEPDPAKLIGLGLTLGDIAEALEQNNQNRGAAYIERNGEGTVVRSSGRIESMEEIGRVVVATRGGVPVRVADLAQVKIGRELRTGSASANGEETVIGTALMRIGANSRTVAAAVDGRLREVARTLPPGIVVHTVLDRTILVDATIRTVATNLAEGALLVVVVLFLLLGNLRGALICALVIPVAMLMTIAGMVQGRISANLMSLGALDFGLIVDGAVIITENALRHLAERQAILGRVLRTEERLEAVRSSAEEMIRPTVYGQAIIMLVYLPLLTFSGIEGKMFAPMALTVLIALASAFLLSLTFVPALIAILITGRVAEGENRLIRGLKALYRPILAGALRWPSAVIGLAILLVLASLVLADRLGQEFMPQLDEKNVAMHAMRIPSTSLTQSQEMQIAVEKAVLGFPEVAFVFSKTGTAEIASDPMPVNVSDTFIMLRPPSEWPDPRLTKEALVAKLQTAVNGVPGNAYEFTQPIQMRFNELLAGTRGDLAVKVFGERFETMMPLANRVAAVLRSTPGAEDVKVEQVEGLPTLDIRIDKGEIARLGLHHRTVQDVIGAAIGGRDVGVVFEGDRRFDIVLRLADGTRDDIDGLTMLPVPLTPGPGGRAALVPLRQVASFVLEEGPNQISRENGKRRVVVTANVRGRDIASVVAAARSRVDALQLPAGSWITWGGQFENLAAARDRLSLVVPGCFALIFLLLYAALGSARDALLVFSAVPMALTGGVLALWLRGMPISVPAAVGFIALSGVAVLNGLVMLSAIRHRIETGVPVKEAVRAGACARLRPVMMTALVAALGFVPMALATGTGAEIQRPLATVVIGGLLSATLLTLCVLPALFARFSVSPVHRAAPKPASASVAAAE